MVLHGAVRTDQRRQVVTDGKGPCSPIFLAHWIISASDAPAYNARKRVVGALALRVFRDRSSAARPVCLAAAVCGEPDRIRHQHVAAQPHPAVGADGVGVGFGHDAVNWCSMSRMPAAMTISS